MKLGAAVLALVLGASGLGAPAESAGDGAPVATLVADIETSAAGGRAAAAYGHVEWNGITYFGASDRGHGLELWRSDGTPEGTRLLADILPGPTGSFPRELLVMGDRLYFTAFDGRHGFALWSSDGTPEGTRLVKGAEGDFLRPGQLVAQGATLLLTAGPHARPALWRSDGTAAGTQKIVDLDPDLPGLSPGFAWPRLRGAVSAGFAWFMSRAGGRRVLWRSDGSAGGTTHLWTDAPTSISSEPHAAYDVYAPIAGGLLFRGRDATGDGLWRADATSGAALLLAHQGPAEPALAPDWFVSFGGATYFLASVVDRGYRDVWRTDGTPAGTLRLTQFAPSNSASQLTAAGDRLFVDLFDRVASDDGSGRQWNLVSFGWLPEIAATSSGAFIASRNFVELASGLPGGTVALSTAAASFSLARVASLAERERGELALTQAPTCLAGACWFRRETALTPPPPPGLRRDVLWRSDLTPAGTGPVLSSAGHTRGSWPEQFADLGGVTYFATTQFPEPAPSFGSDTVRLVRRTSAGTSVVAAWPGVECFTFPGFDAPACRLRALTALSQRLLFFHQPAWREPELWVSDGSPDTTGRLRRLGTVPNPAVRGTGVIADRLVFAVGPDLWASDGTKGGTGPLGAAPNAVAGSADLLFTRVGNWLYFASDSGLWKTAGTPGSVQLVKAVPAAELTDVAGTLYFTSDGQLWKSNGTPAGTTLVAATQGASRLTALGTRLVFTACDALHGCEPWTSDGSAAGTHLLADMRGGPSSSNPDGFVALGARVVFGAANSVFGREPWISDGTREGTLPLGDLHPGPQGSLDDGPIFVSAGARVFFPAFTPGAGVELWSSDGTPGGTALVQDIAPGAAGSHPRELAVIGSRLFFSADDGLHGQEPWSLDSEGFAEGARVTRR